MSPAILETIDPENELQLIEAELCRRSFRKFAARAWREIDPAPLIWNWHLDAICDHLQAVAQGQIDKLLINVPPGHAKSNFVSVLYPAWRWAIDPSWRVMTSSYEMTLATRDATKSRDLIQGDWYRAFFAFDEFGQPWNLDGDQNVKTYYQNSALGFRICLSVGGKGTGLRGNALIVDDPLNAQDANSKVARDAVIAWKTATMSSRFNDQSRAEEIVIMQRLHEDDLSGFLLKDNAKGDWVHLCLPSEFEPKRKCITYARPLLAEVEGERREADRSAPPVKFYEDPRKEEGELLFPAKFSRKVLEDAKNPRMGMGAIQYAGQHQQTPMPASGGAIQRAWLSRRWFYPSSPSPSAASILDSMLIRKPYDPLRAHLPTRTIFTDAAFKKASDNDRVAIGVFDLVGTDLFQIDCRWGNMGIVDTILAILELHKKWRNVGRVCVEDKANGPAIMELLEQKIPGLVAIEPLGSKEARIAAASPFMHAGNVWLAEDHEQTGDMVNEACAFPKGSHDDWIDMVSYAVLLNLSNSDAGFLEGLVKWK